MSAGGERMIESASAKEIGEKISGERISESAEESSERMSESAEESSVATPHPRRRDHHCRYRLRNDNDFSVRFSPVCASRRRSTWMG